jgi:hypothetical protein
MEIIITDLTRFSNPEIVCIAGINMVTNQCIRPLPYISVADCKRLNILPGNVINGDFTKIKNIENPHSEDCNHTKLNRVRICDSDEFQELLDGDLVGSISEGFGYDFPEKGKVIPKDFTPTKSIVTLKINTRNIEIVKDGFKEGNIRLNLLDNDGKRFSFLSITDLGFYNYAMKHFHDANFPQIINDFIRRQESIYLRIGLGREYQGGFWLQINGIYTFPNFDTEIRSYS